MAHRRLSTEMSAGVLLTSLSARARHHIDQMLFYRKAGYHWHRISHGHELNFFYLDTYDLAQGESNPTGHF